MRKESLGGLTAGLILVLLFTGCDAVPETTGDTKTLTGTVFYRERVLLPPEATIDVYLEDVSRMDAPAEVLAHTSLSPQGGPPWAFTLEYDPSLIDNRHDYVLRARIELNGSLIFINKTRIPVFTEDADSKVEIMVSRVQALNTAEGKPDATLTETYWKPVELEGDLAVLGAGDKELSMVLADETRQVRGYSGCNQFTGSYEVTDDKISFSQMASTMRACAVAMEQEQRFLRVLAATTRYTISGDNLMLYGEGDRVLVRFEAVYLY